ncbi:MAG: ABC transporter ATP-binding protein [Planctomycetia bacterium]|nr:ABC transporter ATP-binding protein [Planctomycetia bacterium]
MSLQFRARNPHVIEVDDFHKTFADHVAVRGLTFRVEPGELLAIIGPNGAGKTTTMRALAGIIPPSRGRLSIAGFDVQTDAIAAKSRLAFVPDEAPLFHDLTVEEHLSFYASIYQVRQAHTKALRLLEEFELTSKRRTPASDLSRGMRQKLAICCAYLHDPTAILLDEPLTGLDPQGIRVFKRSLQERAARGAAVVISSHMLAMVEDLCTRVLVLTGGVQRFFGPVDDLRASFEGDRETASLEDVYFAATSS